MKVKFAYNEPRFGDIEIEGPSLTDEEIVKEIEMSYPEAIDIELLEKEEEDV